MYDNIYTSIPPKHITLCISNVCQQRCRFCRFDHDGRINKFISLQTIERMDWLHGAESLCISGSGEALVHPQYVQIMRTVRQKAPRARLMLYTNGLGLFGKNLDVTVRYADIIHISQNAVTQKAYDAVIQGGNYNLAMRNLKALAKAGAKEVHLSFVLVRENMADIRRGIEIAANYGFKRVIIRTAMQPVKPFSYSLLPESFDVEDFDISAHEELAKSRGVEFVYNKDRGCGESLCWQPWTYLLAYLHPSGEITIEPCCHSYAGIVCSEKALTNFDKVFNNSRIAFIRKTVNNPELLPANKMYLACRMSNRFASPEEKVAFRKKMQIDQVDGRPVFFDTLTID